MELTELIIKYINNPSEEIKKEYDNAMKTTSSINILYTINKINEYIETETDEERVNKLIGIQKVLANTIKDSKDDNYIFDEQRNRIVRKK